jgi:hypothetical protein
METTASTASDQKVSRYADMFSAMGAEARLRIGDCQLNAVTPSGQIEE